MIAFVVSAISLFLISITMLARANDLRWRSKPDLKWLARMFGFILSGCAPVGMVGLEFATKSWPSPYEVIFRVGLMLVFVTTPYLPPWWRWISGSENGQPVWTDDRRRNKP